MTKTLTEQWRDGTLAGGDYYIKTTNLGIDKIIINYYEEELKQFDGLCNCSVAEILAPVPSYDKWQAELDSNDELLNVQKRLEKKIKLLEEQLNNALETMGQVAKLSDNVVDSVQCAHSICLINERLKEMEGVK